MAELPKRKPLRVLKFDYSTSGKYFITACTFDREKLFWKNCRGDLRSPDDILLSDIGMIVKEEIQKLDSVYAAVRVDTYCIMPDHVHMILNIETDSDGRPQVAPTISRIMNQWKGTVTKKAGSPVWQKSFYDHVIRNQKDYDEIWTYIENNPYKYVLKNSL